MNPQAARFPDSRCTVHSCNYAVAGISRHVFCNRHRECNNQGYYDPEKCNICRSMYSKANSDGSVGNKSLIAGLLRTMSKSTAFYHPVQWANPEFKSKFHDPLDLGKIKVRSRSSTPAAGRMPPPAHPRSSSLSNTTPHINPNSQGPDVPRVPNRPSRVSSRPSFPTEPPRASTEDHSGRPSTEDHSGHPSTEDHSGHPFPSSDTQDAALEHEEHLLQSVAPRSAKRMCKQFPALKAVVRELRGNV